MSALQSAVLSPPAGGAAPASPRAARPLLYALRRIQWRLFLGAADRRSDAALPHPTRDHAALEALTVGGAHAAHGREYSPSPARVLHLALRDLRAPLERFTFVDFGSGKGRMLLAAAQHPFHEVVGVEFALELHRAAEDNLRAAGVDDCVRAVHADATAFPIPPGPCVFYLFNPFGEPVLRRVIENIEASWRAQPRPMFVIYFNPEHGSVLGDAQFLERVRRPWLSRLRHALFGVAKLEIHRTVGL